MAFVVARDREGFDGLHADRGLTQTPIYESRSCYRLIHCPHCESRWARALDQDVAERSARASKAPSATLSRCFETLRIAATHDRATQFGTAEVDSTAGSPFHCTNGLVQARPPRLGVQKRCGDCGLEIVGSRSAICVDSGADLFFKERHDRGVGDQIAR
jgi:hypothetical protein